MSSQAIAVELEERTVLGKGLGALRHQGKVPAVIHNHGQASIHVMGDSTALSKVYATAGKHHPVEVTVAGKHHLALIKDADFEPTKHRLRHLVFQAIKQDEAVTAEIPIDFIEDAEIPAEKISLLVLRQLTHVEVKALPKDLPDVLLVDPGKLADVGDHLTVADLKIPSGVTVLTEPETQIAIVEMPKDQIAEADAAAAELAADAATGVPADDTAAADDTDAKEAKDSAEEE